MFKLVLAAALVAGNLNAFAATHARPPEQAGQMMQPRICWILPTVGCV